MFTSAQNSGGDVARKRITADSGAGTYAAMGTQTVLIIFANPTPRAAVND